MARSCSGTSSSGEEGREVGIVWVGVREAER